MLPLQSLNQWKIKTASIKNWINPLFFKNSPERENPVSSKLTSLHTWSGQLLPLHTTTHAPSCYSPLLVQEQAIFPWACQPWSRTEPRQQLSLQTSLSPSSHNRAHLLFEKVSMLTPKTRAAVQRPQSILQEKQALPSHSSRTQQMSIIMSLELPRPWALHLPADG